MPHPPRDGELIELVTQFSRSSHRPKKKRDLDEEADKYLPRQGCHYSLPPGKVACHLHEQLRLSKCVPYDPGPAPSD